MNQSGPSEECQKCGHTKDFGAPCKCDQEEINWQLNRKDEERDEHREMRSQHTI